MVYESSYSYSPFEEFPSAALCRPNLFMSYAPAFKKGRKQHRVIMQIPRMVHQRLTPVSAPPRRHRLNNVYDTLEYGRWGGNSAYALVNYRPTPPPIPLPRSRITYIEDVTNRSGMEEIERETRSVHREMDNMMYRVSAGRQFTPSLYSMNHIPMRSASEVKDIADMRRSYVRERNPGLCFEPFNKAELYRVPLIHYPSPAALGDPKYYYIGRGNLACLSFAGGRPIPKRRRFYPGYGEEGNVGSVSVRDDVTFRSFYSKQRNAANIAANYARATRYQPLHYSKKTLMGENGVKREKQESKWVQRAMANTKEPAPSKRLESSIAKSSIKEVRRESITKEPKVEPPPPSRPLNVTLPGPRKSITEIAREDLQKIENLPEETVLLRRPSKLDPVPSTPPVTEVKAEETFKIPAKKASVKAKEATPPPPKEPTPPPKEPTPPPKEPTPPPKEPTPPPKEPTPPPKEPTPPPPKEPTPPPPEPVVEPEVVEEVAAVAAATLGVTDDAAGAESDVSGVAEGSDVESNKGEGDVAEIPLDEEAVVLEEPSPAETGLPSEVEAPEPEAPAQEVQEEQEPESTPAPEPEPEVVEIEAQVEEPTPVAEEEESQPEPEVVEVEAVEESVPPPAEEEVEAEAEADEVDEEIEEVEVEAEQVDEGQEPQEEEEEVAPGVSILVADIDGPIEPQGGDEEEEAQEPMTVEQIQANAERKRCDFAKLLEEHHEIVEKIERLEHPTVPKLDPVCENSSTNATISEQLAENPIENGLVQEFN